MSPAAQAEELLDVGKGRASKPRRKEAEEAFSTVSFQFPSSSSFVENSGSAVLPVDRVMDGAKLLSRRRPSAERNAETG